MKKKYLHISIPSNKENYGKNVKVYCKNKLIWGIQLESGVHGYNLEYKNIPISNKNIEDYNMEPYIEGVQYNISNDREYYPEQLKYNNKYNIIHEKNLSYSKLGNTVNPNKLLVTFPGFGKSTSRIPYAISAMSFLSEDIKDDTCIIAFQDNYYVAGNYMLQDENQNNLKPYIEAKIDSFMREYSINEKNLILFGASKGGTIALNNYEKYKNSKLIISVPQMNLEYYFRSKAFFRNNIYHYYKKNIHLNLVEKLNKYVEEGRDIHYFYSENDELSNWGIVEDLRKINKYCVDGIHGEVTKKAIISFESLMRNESQTVKKISVDLEYAYEKNQKLYLKLYVPYVKLNVDEFDAYIKFNDTYWKIDQVKNAPFILMNNEKQGIDLEDFESFEFYLYLFAKNGDVYNSKLELNEFINNEKKINHTKTAKIQTIENLENADYSYLVTDNYQKKIIDFTVENINENKKIKKIIFTDNLDYSDDNSVIIKFKIDNNHHLYKVFVERILIEYKPFKCEFITKNAFEWYSVQFKKKKIFLTDIDTDYTEYSEVLRKLKIIAKREELNLQLVNDDNLKVFVENNF